MRAPASTAHEASSGIFSAFETRTRRTSSRKAVISIRALPSLTSTPFGSAVALGTEPKEIKSEGGVLAPCDRHGIFSTQQERPKVTAIRPNRVLCISFYSAFRSESQTQKIFESQGIIMHRASTAVETGRTPNDYYPLSEVVRRSRKNPVTPPSTHKT